MASTKVQQPEHKLPETTGQMRERDETRDVAPTTMLDVLRSIMPPAPQVEANAR